MALPPSLWPSRLLDQNFGMCITSNDFLLPFYNLHNYYRPWKWSMPNIINDIGSTINNEKESFKVTLDVQHFRPNELFVKVANNQIIVEGKHEERKDEHGFVSRHFTRRYALPSNCMQDDVISNLSSDGVLTVIANKKITNEKSVPVKLCQSCPKPETAIKASSVQIDRSEVMTDDASNKNKQIMLKEDHCCLLLKPELLRAAVSESSEIIAEKKKENVEQEKLKACQTGKNTSEMLEQTFAKSCATKSASGEKCENTGTSKREERAQLKIGESIETLATSSEKITTKTEERAEKKNTGSIITLAALSDKSATYKTEEIVEGKKTESISSSTALSDKCENITSKTEEVAKQKTAESITTTSASASEEYDITTSKSEELAKQNVIKSSATRSESEEKFDLFDEATASMSSMSTSEILEQTFEKCNIGMSSLSERAGQTYMSKSEMSGVSSMSSETLGSIECATSCSMSSNIIKEMNEELSDIVSEIICFEEELAKSVAKSLDTKK